MIPSPGPYLFEDPPHETYERNKFRPAFQAAMNSNIFTRSLTSNLNLPTLSMAEQSYTMSLMDKQYSLPNLSLLMTEANKKHEDEKVPSPAPSHRDNSNPLSGGRNQNHPTHHPDNHRVGHIHNPLGGHNEVNYVQQHHNNDDNNEGYRDRKYRDQSNQKYNHDQIDNDYEMVAARHDRSLQLDSEKFTEKFNTMDDDVDDLSSVESDTDKSLKMRFQRAPLLRS